MLAHGVGSLRRLPAGAPTLNVRCPHCSAVFPAGAIPENGSKTVECPLCLLRFDAKAESTISVSPASPAFMPRQDGVRELDAFGLGTQTAMAVPSGLTVPLSRAGQNVDLAPRRPSSPQQPAKPAASADEEVDFEALLADAAGAMDKYDGTVAPRTNPFVRISAPRSGTGGAVVPQVESIFGGAGAREPLQPIGGGSARGISSTAIPAPATTRSGAPLAVDTDDTGGAPSQGYGGAGANSFVPFANANATADFLSGFAGGGPTGAAGFDPFANSGGAPAAAAPPAAGDADDSLFESGASYAGRADADPSARSAARESGVQRASPSVAPATKGATKKRGPLITFDRLLLFAMLAAAVGVVTDYLGLGLFASHLWRGPDPGPVKIERPVPKDLATPVHLDDTRKSYELELARIEKVLKIRPDNPGLLERRNNIYLDLLERFPEALQDEPDLKRGFEALTKAGKLKGPRLATLEALSRGDIAGALKNFDALKLGSLDDRGVAARARLADFNGRLEVQALASPGLTASPESDPLRLSGAEDAPFVEAKRLLDAAAAEAVGSPSASKLAVLQAEFNDRGGKPADVETALAAILAKAPEHLEAHLLLASALIDQGKLDDAQKHIDAVTLALAGNIKAPTIPRKLTFVQARLSSRRGDREGQIAALQELVKANAADELAVVRLARLLMAERHYDDAVKLLQIGKKVQKFKSVAFEVVLVEYWLSVNRNEDAAAEIKEADKLYKDSLEIDYLQGQVADKQSHFATARDFFAKVLAAEPKHMRAAIRLAQLQSAANRHDEALATLDRARAQVGDEETLLSLRAEELGSLKRDEEARQVYEQLLTVSPENRRYLLRAAQMDLRAGNADRALTYLRKLRTQKALDREAGIQLAKALADKKSFAEAAQTIEPFADQAPNDIEVNCLAGEMDLNADQVEKAAVYISRAVQIANGKSAVALFQFGRLAFKRGDISAGTSRIRQAIGVDSLAHEYRFELAKYLLNVKNDANSRTVAVEELETIVKNADGYAAANRAVRYLPDVHRQLARAFLEAHEFVKAAKHLRAVLEKSPDDLDSKSELGRCLYLSGDKAAVGVLRDVLARRPNDARASLFLGLSLLNARQTSDALPHLQAAANSGDKRLVESWYHIALIYKEREQIPQALRALDSYLEHAPKDETYRKDAESLRRNLQGSLGEGKKKKGG